MVLQTLAAFQQWFADRREANDYAVTQVPLDRLERWSFDPETGNVGHDSGRFFTVEGIEVVTDHREVGHWTQPIIIQSEIGILGLLLKEFDGALHCLMQAKMEPGNIRLIQLSPTVQATRSNYTGVHRGSPVPYLEHFIAPRAGRVVFDALQSEQGSWFLNKRNRNLIVEVTGDIPVLDDFCWLPVSLLGQLLMLENVVNMDSRTVLSGLPFGPPAPGGRDAGALCSTQELLSWFTEAKSRYALERRRIPLPSVKNWVRSSTDISHESGAFFRVIGLDVHASNREVGHWSQPALAPCGQGVVAFVGRWIGTAFHVLVHARTEAGTADVVEMAPTINCAPANHAGRPPERRPRYLDYVLSAAPEQVLIDVVHSEEGGRFYHAENRYLLIAADDRFPQVVPDDYAWMTLPQLNGFVRHGNYVSVGARSLLACINCGAPAALRRG